MYAIINTGGKQARVSPGDVISIERIAGADGSLSFTPLLVVDDEGAPITGSRLSASAVTAEVLGEEKGPKIDMFTYKNKTGNRRRKGHRQVYTTVRVTGIDLAEE